MATLLSDTSHVAIVGPCEGIDLLRLAELVGDRMIRVHVAALDAPLAPNCDTAVVPWPLRE